MATTLDAPPAARPSSTATAPVKFHISLNVSSLDAAIAFYRVLLGVAPAKCYPDYAKFETLDPPLVLSLEPMPHAAGGALNHLGFRVPTAAALVEIQRRLEAAGMPTNREEGVECCYARQTKFWVKDPDRNLWEVYVLEADTEHRGPGSAPHAEHAHHHAQSEAKAPAKALASGAEVAWEHQLDQPLPATIPIADGKADRILFRGSFNAPITADEQARMLRDAKRALRPGGKVIIHGLGADAPLNGQVTNLPGPAAQVKRVPSQAEMLEALKAAGFSAIRLAKVSASPVFRHEGIGLRENLIEAIKLESSPFDLKQFVQYQGPLREVADDFGNVFRRGERISITTPAVEALRAGSSRVDLQACKLEYSIVSPK